jgi:hypothetical protein
VFGKEGSPELVGLLVDVIFAALAWSCGREEHDIAVPHEVLNQSATRAGRDVFCDLEALHQVETTAKVERLYDIKCNEG